MKRALLVGINYIGTENQLNGCINDIKNVQLFLKNSRNYSDFVKLTDDNQDTLPTKANILKGLEDLVKGAKAGDELWFHFSGHGTLVRDKNGDEESGYDSCICPLDFQDSGFILDDQLRSILVIPDGVKLYVVLDCCHSGTGCDLRYKYEDESYYKKSGRPKKYVSSEWTLKQTMTQFKKYPKSKGDIVMISGCKDTQTSADAFEEGESAGALTYCLLKTIKNNFGNCKWKVFLKDLKCTLKVKGYSQIPIITSGKSMNPDALIFETKQKESIDAIFKNLNIKSLL